MAAAHLPIHRVVGRGDFDYPCPKLRVHRPVGNHFDFELAQQTIYLNFLIYPLGVALIFGIDRHRRVAEFSFRPHRRQCERTILHEVQRVRPFHVVHFQIGIGRPAVSAVVDQAVSPIDQPLRKELFESPINDLDDGGIKREFVAGPIAGGAERPELGFHPGFFLH